MKFEIKRAMNGWLVETCSSDENQVVVAVDHGDEHEAFADFLSSIHEHIGPSEGKYSPKRVHICVLPGRDYSGPLSPEYREKLLDLRDRLNHSLEENLS